MTPIPLVASRLDEVARILEEQGANIFRVGAYCRAAVTRRGLTRLVDQIVKMSSAFEPLDVVDGNG